eukprot:353472-Chlamydomonas_euryale.AAC.6
MDEEALAARAAGLGRRRRGGMRRAEVLPRQKRALHGAAPSGRSSPEATLALDSRRRGGLMRFVARRAGSGR